MDVRWCVTQLELNSTVDNDENREIIRIIYVRHVRVDDKNGGLPHGQSTDVRRTWEHERI